MALSAPILIVSGTNRAGSNALKLSKLIAGYYAEAGIAAEVLDLQDLPPEAFTPGVFASKPPKVVEMQDRVLKAAGLHLVIPEYNGSYPGVLKHFIDLLKFPESFEAKPVAFVGEAAGAWGGLRAVEQMQGVFGYRNAHGYPVRVFIPGVGGKLDSQGKLTDNELASRLAAQATGFAAFAAKVR
jgi:NAD(P)H-dependent FMN reductase